MRLLLMRIKLVLVMLLKRRCFFKSPWTQPSSDVENGNSRISCSRQARSMRSELYSRTRFQGTAREPVGQGSRGHFFLITSFLDKQKRSNPPSGGKLRLGKIGEKNIPPHPNLLPKGEGTTIKPTPVVSKKPHIAPPRRNLLPDANRSATSPVVAATSG